MDILSALQSLLAKKPKGQYPGHEYDYPAPRPAPIRPETGLAMAERQRKSLINQVLTPGQVDPGLLVNDSPFQPRFNPAQPAMKADRPAWEKALSVLSKGLMGALEPDISAAGGPAGKPGRQIMERAGKKIENLLNAPSKTGKTLQTTIGENSKLTLNPATGAASLSGGRLLADLNPVERFSLILQKKLSGVPLTKEDERILAEWERKKK